MKLQWRLTTLAMVLALVTLACGIGESVVPSGGVLFQDDFSSTSSGWDKQRSPKDGVTDYEGGKYRIQVLTSKTRVWANPHLSFTDVHIEVDATRQTGSEDNDFGVICRYKDENNFYYMVVASDGYYGIAKVKDGDTELLGSDRMGTSDYINSGETSNHIRVECVGSSLTLYVNGQKLDSQQDSEFTSGDVGLIVSTYDNAGTDIWFDNFTVTKP